MKPQKSTKVFIVAGILATGLIYLINGAINTPLIQQFDASARDAERAAEESKKLNESLNKDESLTEEQLKQRVEDSRARLDLMLKDMEQKRDELALIDEERKSCVLDNSKIPEDCERLAEKSRLLLSQIKTLGNQSDAIIASTYKDLCVLLPKDSKDFCGKAKELAQN